MSERLTGIPEYSLARGLEPIIATANLSGLTLAWILNMNGGPNAGVLAFVVGVAAALAVGGASGAAMGVVIAYFGAHPILASLAMMIFLKGLGEFLTRGGDISGFPAFLGEIGHGVILSRSSPGGDAACIPTPGVADTPTPLARPRRAAAGFRRSRPR